MRKKDKLKNMVQANKKFEERFKKESPNIQEDEVVRYTIRPDVFPELTQLLNRNKL
jgi:hypothetical protein|tara:strand:+ start:2994 stop:3161 length:168 start_codon:yes stop_codon:yes gene_type:complete